MAVDIAPEISEDIRKSYLKYVDDDKRIAALLKKGYAGKATWADANEFSLKHGEALVRAVRDNVSAEVLPDGMMYYNIAEKILTPNIGISEDIIVEYALKVQQKMVEDAGYNILALKPDHNASKVSGIVELASSKPYDEVKDQLYEVMKNYDQSIVDATIQKNAELLNDLGVYAMVTRIYDGVGLHDGKQPCQWCIERAGTWTYDEANANGVFERHTGCGCTITYTVEGHTDFLKAEEAYNDKTGKYEKTKKWVK